MSTRTEKELIADILEAAQRVMRYCEGMSHDEFISDQKTQDAVTRNIEIIGEAVKNISEQVKTRNTAIPWRNIARMRDRLIHGYFGINWDIVWEVVSRDIPILVSELKKELANLP